MSGLVWGRTFAEVATDCYSERMTIVLVRHGETEGNAARVLQPPELPLNEVGVAQAECLAERLATMPIVHVLSSDLRRAQMTAGPIAQRLGLPIETSPLLAERNFGDLRGTPYANLPGDPFAPDFAPPNGETWEMFYERVADAFKLITARRREVGGDLLVVTHGLVCRVIYQRHVQIDAQASDPIVFANTSVTLLDEVPPHRARLVNCCVHLDGQSARSDLGQV
jgi:2,3-bisphosphoglycerate-dependent phosphoglycerate mutase